MNSWLIFGILSIFGNIWGGKAEAVVGKPIDSTKELRRIAFGSCNNQQSNQSFWNSILATNPDLWIWMGDVVYNDEQLFPMVWSHATIEGMRRKYKRQKRNTYYSQFIQNVPVTGVWDDHDYGMNDGNYLYAEKERSQKEFLTFIDEPSNSLRWKREGIYGSLDIGPANRTVKIILLDTRYFKAPEELGLSGGDILGNNQWNWLKQELLDSKAQIHLIISGTQILPMDKPLVEKWANYPYAYNQLLTLLAEIRPPGVVLMSGDIHYAEILKKECIGLGYPLWEVTSSGLTHSCDTSVGALCPIILEMFMRSNLTQSYYQSKNFGTMDIDWEKEPPQISLHIRNMTGHLVLEQVIRAGIPSSVRQSCPKDNQVSLWRLQPRGILVKKASWALIQIVACAFVIWLVMRIVVGKSQPEKKSTFVKKNETKKKK